MLMFGQRDVSRGQWGRIFCPVLPDKEVRPSVREKVAVHDKMIYNEIENGVIYMEFEQVKQYIEAVKDSKKFGEIVEFTKMTQLKPDEDIYENIRYYLSVFHSRRDCKEWFQPDYEHFVNFLEHYLKNEPSEVVFDERGYLDLSRTLYLVKPIRFAASAGDFTDNHIMLTDGRKYISKLPLNYRSGIQNKYSVFCSLIASNIARTIGVEAAEVTLATVHNGARILSKNFLKPDEELVVYADNKEEVTISEQLNKMEQALRLRKFPEDEIEVAKLEFLKQEFLAKIIGLRDQTPDNSPVIISSDEEGIRHVRLAPVFDLDYSFHIGEERLNLLTRKCDNGQEDICSFIEQYKNYPGFQEFVKKSVESLDMVRVFRQIYQDTGIVIFEDYQNDEQMNRFMAFVNRNVRNS